MPFHKHYDDQWKKALADLYPEHNGFEFFPPFGIYKHFIYVFTKVNHILDSSMVPWSQERKRSVLNKFARTHSFSPQSVSDWYLYTHRDVAVCSSIIKLRNTCFV